MPLSTNGSPSAKGAILKLSRKIEVIANIAIIVVAILLGFTLAKNYFWPTSKDAASRPSVNMVGRKLSLPDVDWAKNERSLVLVLQSNCRFCTESAPFYRELLKRQAAQPNLKLLAVLPDSIDDSKAYLGSLGVIIGEIRQSSLSSIGVAGTPTLLMVDNTGTVTNEWRGRLDSAGEAEIISRF